MAYKQHDDEDYANLLCHAAEDQLYRQHHLEQFIIKYSCTTLELLLHLYASGKLPDHIHHEELESVIQGYKDNWYDQQFSTNGTGEVPYHDDVLFNQFFLNMVSLTKGREHRMFDPVQPWKDQGEDMSNLMQKLLSIYPDFVISRELSYAYHCWHRYVYSPMLVSLYFRFQIALAKAGYKVDKLGFLWGQGHANSVLPPENGYTRVFRRDETVTQEQLLSELLTRNNSIESERLSVLDAGCITIAISYKHYAHRSMEKISQEDIEAIHRFLVASQARPIRFWIDSKLPCTDDASFDRWLKRGVRPYARYFTLVCPSAFEETKRYWIQMERNIAMAAQGFFYVAQDGIYFKKDVFHYRKLCHKMLTMMVGCEGIPPGLRKQDEGKMVQWALGFLGDKDSVKLHQVRGPRVDSLCNRDFQEFTVMRNITYIIKEHGELELPVESGRSWNKDNPLILKGIQNQVLLLPTWIGFVKAIEPRKVYFLNGSILTQVVHGAVVGIEVTLRNAFKKGEKNEVVRKVLRDIHQTELVQLRAFKDGDEIDLDAAAQKLYLDALKEKAETFFLEDARKGEERRNALKFLLQLTSRLGEEKSFERTEENEGPREEPEYEQEEKLTHQFTGMKAAIFAWECDWI